MGRVGAPAGRSHPPNGKSDAVRSVPPGPGRPGAGAGIRSIGTGLVNLLFPPVCLVCRNVLGGEPARCCATCDALLAAERAEPACPRCGQSVGPVDGPGEGCRSCRDGRSHLAGMVRVGPYGPALGRLLRGFKFQGREEFEPILGAWLSEAVVRAPWLERVEAIVPVPTHWRHRVRRPLHAADLLARHVSESVRVPLLRALRRTRAGPHQVGLTFTQRLENVRGVFAMRRRVEVRGKRLLLLDDVRTTGATIEQCASVLRKAGAAEVYGAVLLKVTWATEPTGEPLMV